MEIKIGIGLDSIRFGLLQPELIKILGQPDKINNEEREDHVVLYFNNIMTKFYFNLDSQGKLCSIATINPEASLFGQSVIGLAKENIISLLQTNGVSSFDCEDYESFDTIFCEEIWSSFTFEFNRLREIEFSVLMDDSGNFEKWPET